MQSYLRANIVMEPLVAQWYAWAHLIPPATAARNITERHLRIMDSYITNPEAHAAAARNPKLLGGPFMDFGGNRTADVERLRERTRTECRHLIALSEAIEKLDELLREKATGHSLDSLYALIPGPLRGYVELVYDLNHRASFRLLEPLLYRSKYYEPSLQAVMLSPIHADDRPFVLSTPRFQTPDSVDLQVPFSHPGLDALHRMKTAPGDPQELEEMLGVGREAREVFQSFFTPEAPPAYERYTGDGARWRYFGHACILLETRSTSILFDPVLSYTYESRISRYTYQDLPSSIDYVIITHNHQDHILFETLLQLRHRIGTVIVPRSGGGSLEDPSLKLLLHQCGFRKVIELDDMEELPLGEGSITAIPFFGEHGDLNVRSKAAYVVRVNGQALMFAADSRNICPDLYAHIQREVGDIDILFLGMECDGAPVSWIYGPLFTKRIQHQMDQSRRLAGSDCAQGLDLVERFHCREVYVYAMGQEPWLNYVMSIKYTEQSNPIIQSNRLIQTCRERGICAERLFGEKEILLAKRRSPKALVASGGARGE
ncbi:MAG: MBL fold metallo-hydrolase [Acidobacteriia bacterium]|nr:MBL fold metallo-hydrolase [Terriglobia bacterium]